MPGGARIAHRRAAAAKGKNFDDYTLEIFLVLNTPCIRKSIADQPAIKMSGIAGQTYRACVRSRIRRSRFGELSPEPVEGARKDASLQPRPGRTKSGCRLRDHAGAAFFATSCRRWHAGILPARLQRGCSCKHPLASARPAPGQLPRSGQEHFIQSISTPNISQEEIRRGDCTRASSGDQGP
jgi:hypothetical protein